MEPTQTPAGRKKLLLWGAGLIASFTAWKLFGGSGSKKAMPPTAKKETVTMLTQDGKLVEVNRELLAASQRDKISNEALQNWIKK